MDPRTVADLVKDVMTYAILLSNFIIMLMMWVGKAKAPEVTQNERLKSLEDWRHEVDKRLEDGNKHFEKLDSAEKIMLKDLLALTDHALHGNNMSQLKESSDEVKQFLANNV